MGPLFHVTTGIALTRFFPSWEDKVMILAGSVVNDIPNTAMVIWNSIKHRPCFSHLPRWFNEIQDAIHSLLVWIGLWIFFHYVSTHLNLILTFCIGAFIHVFVDMFTHEKDEYEGQPSWIWPLNKIFPKITLYGKISLFDYRRFGLDIKSLFFAPFNILSALGAFVVIYGLSLIFR
ncbi:hypothetical protein KKD19_04815 [Patescibacteria group bacterium]|nr:hypothetical protein [Patescibacteria group bacterium]MBU4512531.1 hypothetical protein [Patescibacteria group bacterium]MCG2693490.1 hypothetical protein [Candidatus Parcubacteria bacterium]